VFFELIYRSSVVSESGLVDISHRGLGLVMSLPRFTASSDILVDCLGLSGRLNYFLGHPMHGRVFPLGEKAILQRYDCARLL
jgi:hypothetical protein